MKARVNIPFFSQSLIVLDELFYQSEQSSRRTSSQRQRQASLDYYWLQAVNFIQSRLGYILVSVGRHDSLGDCGLVPLHRIYVLKKNCVRRSDDSISICTVYKVFGISTSKQSLMTDILVGALDK